MQTHISANGATWESLQPQRTDRIVLVGQTGSGKTTLARYLLSTAQPYRVVIDYKGTLDWDEYSRCNNLKSLTKHKDKTLLYRPSLAESVDDDAKNRLWEWLYRRGNTTVYVDETAAATNGDVFPFYYGGCLMRGRELGIELWSATQRPTRIPQVVLSESEHVYAFRLRLPQDRERVEALTGIDRKQIAALAKRQFLYARQDSETVGPVTLKLS